MSDLNPTQRQEALDTIDDAMRVLGGMGRQGLNVRLQRLRKALSNPTSSVSTEGVAEYRTAVEALMDEVDALDMSWYDDPTILGVREAVEKVRAINPDSPVEPTEETP